MNDKLRFLDHLRMLGFESALPREQILERLADKMGAKRFQALFRNRAAAPTPQAQEAFYGQFNDLIEANLMRSLDGEATVEASFHLYRRFVSELRPGMHVIELGSWTGGLASFIAVNHPEVHVTAVDMARNVIDACSQHFHLPNLSFEVWDYNFAKPEGVKVADVMLCSMGVVHKAPENGSLFDPADVSRSGEFKMQRDQAVRYFGAWRLAAKPSATLHAIFRVAPFPRFLAWNKAAEHAGWNPQLERMSSISIDEGRIRLPSLVFRAEQGAAHDESEVLRSWCRVEKPVGALCCLKGTAALATFRALNGRSTLGRREYRRSSVLAADEVGLANHLGYLFTYDALANFRLLILSAEQAHSLSVGIKVPGSRTEITDAGDFDVNERSASIELGTPSTGSFSQRFIA